MKKSLFGWANTTKSIAKSGGWDIYDDKFDEIWSDQYGNKLLPPSKFDPLLSELEIPSPGFPPKHDLVKKAKNLISEYDYFDDTTPLKIWISGTNGKTTTTQMTGFLLEKWGGIIGGNVGTPLGELDKNAKIWILETSSFTIHYTKFAVPNLYILLPVTPDHLSWHGSFEEYEKAKLKPLLKMKTGSVALIPKKYENYEISKNTLAKVIFYENEDDLAKLAEVKISDINFKTPFLVDALLALCVERILFDRADVFYLNNFKIEANKLEILHDKLNRIWVNDTKATNIDAAIQALKRYKDKKIHLILGGDDKGVDLSPVFEEASKMDLTIYAIGKNYQKILKLSDKFNIKSVSCEILQTAVDEIYKVLKKDEVALLSPACASLDQFKSYAERGDKFKEFIALQDNNL